MASRWDSVRIRIDSSGIVRKKTRWDRALSSARGSGERRPEASRALPRTGRRRCGCARGAAAGLARLRNVSPHRGSSVRPAAGPRAVQQLRRRGGRACGGEDWHTRESTGGPGRVRPIRGEHGRSAESTADPRRARACGAEHGRSAESTADPRRAPPIRGEHGRSAESTARRFRCRARAPLHRKRPPVSNGARSIVLAARPATGRRAELQDRRFCCRTARSAAGRRDRFTGECGTYAGGGILSAPPSDPSSARAVHPPSARFCCRTRVPAAGCAVLQQIDPSVSRASPPAPPL